jgi:hypothetical protein
VVVITTPDILKILIPSLVGIAGGWLAGRTSALAALDSWRRSRKDVAATLSVQAIKELATELARAAHHACWITWKARCDPDHLSGQVIEQYDADMHECLPKLLGAQAALAAVDGRSATAIQESIESIFDLDARIGEACISWRKNERDSLANLHAESVNIERRIIQAIKGAAANVLGNENNLVTRD